MEYTIQQVQEKTMNDIIDNALEEEKKLSKIDDPMQKDNEIKENACMYDMGWNQSSTIYVSHFLSRV